MSDTITVRGFAGTTPEHRSPSSGTEVTTLRLGSTPRWRNAQTGEWSSGSTNWYTVAAFGRLAKNVAESICKGDPIVVVGRPKVRQWENDDGIRGTDMEVNAQSVAHDLNYGRTDFTKFTNGSPRTEEQADSVNQEQPTEALSPQTQPEPPTQQNESAQQSGAAEPVTGWDPEPALQHVHE